MSRQSKTEVAAFKREVRSTLRSGHRRASTTCPFRAANRRTGRAYRWPGASSRDRHRLPREVVRPKVNGDGRQAQSDANPEDRRMMDQSSVARSGLHSITSEIVQPVPLAACDLPRHARGAGWGDPPAPTLYHEPAPLALAGRTARSGRPPRCRRVCRPSQSRRSYGR